MNASMPTEIALPAAVARILESRTFEKSPTLRALLAYLWQHRDDPISEYAIATEALGRSAMFNAKTDATVRVQISRLRQRLDKYYEQEGASDPERIVLPLGAHQVRLEPFKEAPQPRAAGHRLSWPAGRAISSPALLLLSLILAILLYRSHAATPASPAPARFWQTFFANSRPTRIVLPTPVFFSFAPPNRPQNATIMLRDTEINDFSDSSRSDIYRTFSNKLGPAALAENYTVTSDTFAAVKLARYLDRASLETSLYSNADAPAEALENENVIAIGTWGTLNALKPYLDRMNFRLGPHEQFVEASNPPAKFEEIVESPERSIWPGVIAVVPGQNRRTHLLVLAGRHTSALVSFLTSSNGLDQLDRIWKDNGSPEYYELVVNAEMSGRTLVRFWPAAMRPYRP